jgi:hypothetical protein
MERSIFIGFSTPKKKKLFSELIKLWTGAPYSHVFIRFESIQPQIPSSVYHAAAGMVHFLSKERFCLNNAVVKEYEIKLSQELRSEILGHCISLSGEPYGFCELIKILYTDVRFFFGRKITTYNGTGYICSELVGKILSEKFAVHFDIPLHLLKPNHIDQAIQKAIEAGLLPIQQEQ